MGETIRLTAEEEAEIKAINLRAEKAHKQLSTLTVQFETAKAQLVVTISQSSKMLESLVLHAAEKHGICLSDKEQAWVFDVENLTFTRKK